METLRPSSSPLYGDLAFQVTDIADRDSYDYRTHRRTYEIMMTGTTIEGMPITTRVRGFCPFFYVRIPDEDVTGEDTMKRLEMIRDVEFKNVIYGPELIEESDKTREFSISQLMARIRSRAMRDQDLDDETRELLEKELDKIKENPEGAESTAKDDLRNGLSDVILPTTYEIRQDLYWYKGEDSKERYYKLRFKTKSSYYNWIKILLDTNDYSTKIQFKDGKTKSFMLYEANLEPTLRFIHATNIKACGWVKILCGLWEYDTKMHPSMKKTDGESSDSDDTDIFKIHHTICNDYRNLQPSTDQGISPLLIASFDIECDSTHGDFPLAKKNWEREIRVIGENYEESSAVICSQLRDAILGEETELFGKIHMKSSDKITKTNIEKIITESLIDKIKRAFDKSSKIKNPEAWGLKCLLSKLRPRKDYELEGDRIIQIGTTFYRNNDIVFRHIVTLGSCDKVPMTETVAFDQPDQKDAEINLIREWISLIKNTDPDIITGYNITFFDMAYIYDRCEELGITKELVSQSLSRFPKTRARYTQRTLSSAAMGDNFLKTIEMPGRIVLDLCAAVRRNFPSLDSYKLDNVAKSFLFGGIKSKEDISDSVVKFAVSNTFGLKNGGYMHACDHEGESIGGKLQICEIDHEKSTLCVNVMDKDIAEDLSKASRWTQAKDDVPPSEIFRLQKGSSKDRMIVAKYCVQDCDLVLDLLKKLDLVPNAMAMGSVCSVPLSYIFFRGQTIKLASLLYAECERMGLIVPVLHSPTVREMNDSYEGAVVLEPKTGLYLEQPVAVLDYSSLYPSSMISENISHDSVVYICDKDKDGNIVSERGNKKLADKLGKEKCVDVTFNRYEPDPEDKRKHPQKICVGTRTCTFVQFEDGKKGIIGSILQQLLGKRKETKKRMKKEKDPFKKGLLNSLQLAYKVTANSLYGALGAKNSKIRFQDLAASTTATGRKLLEYARYGIERAYGNNKTKKCDAKYVYGDTDSVFVMFQPKNDDGTPMKGRDALVRSIELAKEAETMLTAGLRAPHCLEYEKTFYPFMLFSKKRYIGMKYEEDPDSCKQTNMGVVLKRRDNAPIVKEIYQSVVDTILKERDLTKSVNVAKTILKKLTDGGISMKKLTITKSLRAHYANPESIAHKVLAERIGVRDPGNKPKSNDRIAFVYFDASKTRDSKKQGDRIETPEFMRENKLKPDYKHYITNQIQKPLTQLFRLFWTQVPDSSISDETFRLKRADWRQSLDPPTKERQDLLIERMVDSDIEKVIFRKAIDNAISTRSGNLHSFGFKKKEL